MKTIHHLRLQKPSQHFFRMTSRAAIPIIGAASLLFTQTSLAAEEMSHEHHEHMEHQQHATHAGHGPHGTHIHHQHGKGGFMFEYRFMRMEMDGLLIGTESVEPNDPRVLNTGMSGPYMMAPTKMTMDMHMLMGMYGFTERLTGMLMLNYLSNDMDMVNRAGVESSMDTSGVGDTRLSAMYTVNKQWTGTLGLGLPTGSIDEKVTMMGNERQAPYAMQLGSGTYDLIPSVTYKDEKGNSGWGAQFEYTFRIGENDNKYSLGDKAQLTGWYVHRLGNFVHLSGRLDYMNWNKIDGEDPNIPPPPMPAMATSGYPGTTDDPNNYGGQRLDLLVGLTGVFGAHRVGLEVGKPIYQDLNGPQMETDIVYSLGYQFMM